MQATQGARRAPRPVTVQPAAVAAATVGMAAVVGVATVVSPRAAVAVTLLAILAITVTLTARGTVTRTAVVCAAAIPAGPAAATVFNVPGPVTAAMAGLGLLTVAALRSPCRGDWRRWQPALTVLAIAVVVSLAVGVVNGNPRHEYARTLVMLAPLAAFALAPRALAGLDIDRTGRVLLGSIVAFAALMCLLALGHPPMITTRISDYWHGSPRYYFHNSFLLPSAAATLAALVVGGDRRAVCCGALAVVTLAALYSQTRQVLIWTVLFAAAGALFGALRHRSHQVRAERLILVAITAGMLLIGGWTWITTTSGSGYTQRLAARFSSLTASPTTDSTAKGRFATLQLAEHQAAHNFPQGAGLGALFDNPWSTSTYNQARYYLQQPVVDNLPLTVLVKLGLLGLIAYVLLFWQMFRIARAATRRLRAQTVLGAGDAPLLLAMFTAPALLLLSAWQAFMATSEIMVAVAVIFALADRQLAA